MSQHYRFGNSEVRGDERQLFVDGVPASLGARAFDVLLALIERRDRVVEKAELFDAVWPGLVVEENNLQVQVSSLRKVLGPRAIATIPGRGYQFTARLEVGAPGARDESSAIETVPNNLPLVRTRFIGREPALRDCAGLLRETRLLTLSGIGGCGKTRLAQELAQRRLTDFPDGVWFVDLGPLQEAQLVSATVASTLGVQTGQLTDYLKARRAMVVLDNCEHVVGAAAASIETLLGNCSALKILVTSREVLGMKGEQVFAVRSLTLPETTDLEDIRASEAVRLFVDNARLVVPDFEVTEHNASAIAEICRRLDGIALAIELAASRVRVLSVEEIRARLDDRFRLLTGGTRALPRHQTLLATMQWSHDLLTPPQQHLFRRLAVFAGGCTLAAAADVAGEDADEYDVLELLTALHDKSLLLVDRDSQTQPRYRMLETVRQYAEERLNEAGESDAVRDRHLLHYVGLSEQAAPEMRGKNQGAWYAILRHEQENLVAAHAWCAHSPQGGALALRLAAASFRYWIYSEQCDRGNRLAVAALKLAGTETASKSGCEVLGSLFWFALKTGRFAELRSLAERHLALARRIGHTPSIIEGLRAVAISLDTLREHSSAIPYHEEARDLARATGDAARLDLVMSSLAGCYQGAGDFAAAEALYRDSLLHQSQDNAHGRAIILCNFACLLIATGRPHDARAALAESRSLTKMIGYKGMVECATDIAAALASSLDQHATAARLNGAMLRQLEEAGVRHDPSDEAFFASWIARSRAAMGGSAFEAAQAAGWALTYPAAMAELDGWLAGAGDSPLSPGPSPARGEGSKARH
ncbi:MAG TPA: winged helix-turn-helix domain-containing protein [Burkholderiaceae bacterium]|nr:winged helix-turn-helix domain-containing protein [Burkholderiaceae bacterium]